MSRRRRRRRRRRKFFRKLANAASRIVKNKTGIDLGTVKSKKSKSLSPRLSETQAQTRQKVESPPPASQEQVQPAVDRMEAANSTGVYPGGNVQKIKDWFLIKWHTAKGMLIGTIVGGLLVASQLLGWIDVLSLLTGKKKPRTRGRR